MLSSADFQEFIDFAYLVCMWWMLPLIYLQTRLGEEKEEEEEEERTNHSMKI